MRGVLTWRYRRRAVSDAVLLPPLAVNTVACTLFLLAGGWTLGSAIDAVVVADGARSGQWFSAAPVALAAAVGFGWRGRQDLRRPERTAPPPPAS
jgi:hypothetical protein